MYITHCFQAGPRRAGLPVVPFHALRHYFVSCGPQLWANIAVMSKTARHASIKTTEDVYTGVLDEMQRYASDSRYRARRSAFADPADVNASVWIGEKLRVVG